MHIINFHEVGKHHEFPAVIKLLAREFIEGASYFTTAKWLEQLSQVDLEMLVEQSEMVGTHEGSLRIFLMLMELLVVGEGEEADIELAQKRASYLITVILLESLYRKGMVEFERESVSFGIEEMNNVVAWPKGTSKPTLRKSASDES